MCGKVVPDWLSVGRATGDRFGANNSLNLGRFSFVSFLFSAGRQQHHHVGRRHLVGNARRRQRIHPRRR